MVSARSQFHVERPFHNNNNNNNNMIHYKCCAVLIVFLLCLFSISFLFDHVFQSKSLERRVSICARKRKVLWFMAIQSNEKSVASDYYTYVLAALKSAKVFAPSLAPVLIHGGSVLDVPLAVREVPNLRLISHNLTFYSEIIKSVKSDAMLGPWYRFDIPHIVRTSSLADLDADLYDLDFVLYTDTDVLFFDDFNECSLAKPRVLYLGPEAQRGTQSNSGLLYMNVTAMSEHWPNVLQLAVQKNFSFDAHDQGLFLEYFVGKKLSTLLPDRFNWKGYWGGAKDVVIAHFHGPKPGRCLDCFQQYRKNFKTFCSCHKVYKAIYNMVPDGGEFYERMQFAFQNFTR